MAAIEIIIDGKIYNLVEASNEQKPEWEIVEFRKSGFLYRRGEKNQFTCFELTGHGKKTQEDLLRNPENIIHKVKRLSDGEVFSVGDEVGGKHCSNCKIRSFNIVKEKMMVECGVDYFDLYWATKKSKPKEEVKEPERKGCGICGGVLVMIRGKYPGMDKREVCPTCNTERLEQINEISSKSYGQASSLKQVKE